MRRTQLSYCRFGVRICQQLTKQTVSAFTIPTEQMPMMYLMMLTLTAGNQRVLYVVRMEHFYSNLHHHHHQQYDGEKRTFAFLFVEHQFRRIVTEFFTSVVIEVYVLYLTSSHQE